MRDVDNGDEKREIAIGKALKNNENVIPMTQKVVGNGFDFDGVDCWNCNICHKKSEMLMDWILLINKLNLNNKSFTE